MESGVESILADIGGTNARFSLLDKEGSVTNLKIYQVREIPTLLAALQDYRSTVVKDRKISVVALAVAGPVLGDVVALTNSDWICDRREISAAFDGANVRVLNDFEAVAIAVGSLKDSDVQVVQAGTPSPSHPKIIMGPGTGLGVAALKPVRAGGYEAITTEAGHSRYAPANERERNIVKFLSQNLGFVSAEDLISGPGLVNLYMANCYMAGVEAKPCQPSDVVTWAREGDRLCCQVLDDFAAIFGSFASQVALSYNALGGVYLAGGVLQKMGAEFEQRRFIERFATNPRMADLLRRMPVCRVLSDIPAFDGLKVVAQECS